MSRGASVLRTARFNSAISALNWFLLVFLAGLLSDRVLKFSLARNRGCANSQMTLRAVVRTRLLETVDIRSSELIVALFSGSNRHVNTHCATSGSL